MTVFAVFDANTQIKLKNIQNKILELGYEGSQTMDIPFHISLGSYPIECAEELIEKIKSVCLHKKEFYIRLERINHFNDEVLFAEPIVNPQLQELHSLFDNNFADSFPWHAHATIFCGEKYQVDKARDFVENNFVAFDAKIVGIYLGEFFPTKILIAETFK